MGADAADARALAERVLAGEMRAGARLMRLIDDQSALGLAAFSIVHRQGREAVLLGITGAPGAGKSSLIDRLIEQYRALGQKVGVVAIDPTSPVTGGAVLADRVRMQRHALDEGVFVRSLASRGQFGGLSASASATARVMEAMGFDVVILETVGIGQSEVDVARVADTVVALFAPGLGDDVQAMKAGLMEVPDVFVVTKVDRPGAEHVARDLEMMIHLAVRREGDWEPRVVKTSASSGEGVAELIAEVARHRAHLISGGSLVARRVSRARLDVETALLRELRARLIERAGGERALEEAAARIASRASDPVIETALLLKGDEP